VDGRQLPVVEDVSSTHVQHGFVEIDAGTANFDHVTAA
jgi:hypothetical protein